MKWTRRASDGLTCRAILTALGILLFGPITARAAELRLRPECPCRSPVVTLGDVAEVLAADATQRDTLAAMELFPAPPPGGKRFLPVRELQDLLLARGIPLVEHRLSGASQVVIFGPAKEDGAKSDRSGTTSSVQEAEDRVRRAVLRYLRNHVSDAHSWTVDPRLNDAQARLVTAAGEAISVAGGAAPWVGTQRLELTLGGPQGRNRLLVDVEVTLPPAVVVAARSLARGAVIRLDDVSIEEVGTIGAPSEAFGSVDEVIGRETTRPIPAGDPILPSSIRQPLLVRRGEVVTVYARSAGVQVRTIARAREEGSLGDLIAVESLLDRAPYFARVSGVQEVEVYARASQADGGSASGLTRRGGGRPARTGSVRPLTAGRQPPSPDSRTSR